ncbi:hypothetical protein GCM10023149_02990 [Mucilaginibacter gynuensis]|uniref:DUF4442 domain-containing protein n=1 Tax=Mucilaginibacter gynuensis TaxID=1302236 RepID=A0ABP8FQE7_9SPHI
MRVSENRLKWIMRLYPPMLFQRIWVVKFEPGFRGVTVRVKKSFLNKNYNKSIFGGTIFSAADPFYPVLFHQIFSNKGYRIIVWLKACDIRYIKPARTTLSFTIQLSDNDITEAENNLNRIGKNVKAYPIEMIDENGILCASLLSEVYMRNLDYVDNKQTAAV